MSAAIVPGFGRIWWPRSSEFFNVWMRSRALNKWRFPGYRLHPLGGDMKRFWSVTVNGNWRVIFRFEEWPATNVDLIDYH